MKPSLLIADHAATRLGVRIALDGAVHVCAEADDAEQAIDAAFREQPEVCLVGLEMPGDGITATRGICRVAPESAVIVLAASLNAGIMLSCLHAGAIGCLASNIGAAPLRRVVAAVRQGEAAIPRSMVLTLVSQLCESALTHGGLTAREIQVLNMLRRGDTTAGIAQQLGISRVTVRRHLSTMVRKTGVRDRAALAASSPGHRWPGANQPPLRVSTRS